MNDVSFIKCSKECLQNSMIGILRMEDRRDPLPLCFG
jgi:hypothetical protein